MTQPRSSSAQNHPAYTSNWPVLNFFNTLVNDPQLAKDFEQASPAGRGEILQHFGLDPAEHMKLFIPSGAAHPLTEEDIRKIFEAALKELKATMPENFW